MSGVGPNAASGLSAKVIVEALRSLSDELGKRQTKGEICLFGGAVMVLAFQARVSTRDVDAIFSPAQLVRDIADEIGEAHGFDKNWLNDGVKGFIASAPPITAEGLPQFENLRVTMPTAEYLLAMKCIAGRIGEGATDFDDIRFLIRRLGLHKPEQALEIVARYYGKSGIPVRTQYLIEGIFEGGDA
jgi:hypothetical protein